MTFTKDEITKIESILALSNSPVAEKFRTFLQGVIDDPERAKNDEIDLIDRNHYFATILWEKEDIVTALETNDIEPSEAAIALIYNELDVDGMEGESTLRGWDFINQAIWDHAKDLEELNGFEEHKSEKEQEEVMER